MLSANISPQFINNRLSGPSIDTSSRPLGVSFLFFFFLSSTLKSYSDVRILAVKMTLNKMQSIRKLLIVKQGTDYIDNRFFCFIISKYF